MQQNTVLFNSYSVHLLRQNSLILSNILNEMNNEYVF